MKSLLERLRNTGIKGKRNSSNQFVGRCPFHKGNHDTFAVNLETGLYFCFSAKCHAKGHVSKLVGQIDQEIDLSFNEKQMFEKELPEVTKFDPSELEDYKTIHPYILQRGFDKLFLMKNLIGFDRQSLSITIPVFLKDSGGKEEYYGCIRRTTIPGVEPKYQYPKGFPKRNIVYTPLYTNDDSRGSMGRILAVEGSINALKAAYHSYESASMLGCSPNDEQIELLIRISKEKGKKICWLFDNDESGIEGVKRVLRQYFWLDCDVAEIKSLKYVDNGKDLCYTKIVDENGSRKRIPKNDIDELSRKELDYVVSQAKDRFEYELESF